MGKGREIGAQLRTWLARGDLEPLQARVLEGVLLDALGQDIRLRGPVRDLALQPLLLKLLQERSPGARRSMLDTLTRELADTYAPAVLTELLDLLEAATGLPLPSDRPAAERPESEHAVSELSESDHSLSGLPESGRPASGPSTSGPEASQWDAAAAVATAARNPLQAAEGLGHGLLALAPALALAFANALVMQWLGGELAQQLPADWSSGLVLVLALAALQLLLLRPLARLRRSAPLRLEDSGDPHRLWRWLTAPWVHHRQGEALLNGLMLLILLGDSSLPLGQLLLRYLLTGLATMAPAVLLARRWLRAGVWDGATGAVAALIALAMGVSLLQWRPVSFPFGVLTVPVWVLFLVYGAIQMGWVLPRRVREERALPWQRLLCSCWFWGSAWGLIWALLTRLQVLLETLLQTAGRT